MILYYFILSFFISAGFYFIVNKSIQNILIILFLILQWSFSIYEFLNMNIYDLDYFKPDAISVLLLFTMSIIAIPAFYFSRIYNDTRVQKTRHTSVYFSALTLLIVSISSAYLSSHIAITWIFTELTTLAAVVLIYHQRTARTLEASWKYLFLAAISIAIFFIGILFLSLAKGDGNLQYDVLIKESSNLNIYWLRLAFIFIFTGLTVKIGLVPMYTAGIDAKDKAPSPVSAILATCLANVGFIGVWRVYAIIFKTEIAGWAGFIMILSAILSIFVAAIYILRVRNIKRMLAYSGLEHLGIAILGVASGGIGYYASIMHVVLHSFVKSGMFFQYNQIYRTFKSKSVYDAGNYYKYNIYGAVSVFIGYICISAIPPSGLFITELLIIRSLIEANYIVILILMLLLLTIIIYGFSKNIFNLLFSEINNVTQQITNIQNKSPHKLQQFLESYPQYILFLMTIYLGLNPPDFFSDLINEAVKIFV